MQLTNFDALHVFVEILGAGAVVWGVLYKDRKDRKKESDAQSDLQRKRHEENTQRFLEISTHLEYNPLHIHTERTGNLTVDGLRYGPGRKRNGV